MSLAVGYHAAPDLAVFVMHLPWRTHICGMRRLFLHCVLLSLFFFFIPIILFLGSWLSLKEYQMTAISEPLVSCWHVVLALDCYTKREMGRVRKSIEAHLLAIFIPFHFKWTFLSDVGQGVQW